MKKKSTKHPFRGFDKSPQGSLLDQTIDLDGDMGIAYERSQGFFKDFHDHDRLIAIAPRGSCVMNVNFQSSSKAHRIESSQILLIPKGIIHNDEGLSQIYDTFALLPVDSLILSALKREGASSEKIHSFTKEIFLLKKSDWLDRLLHEYFFERVVSRKMSPQSLRFFEELLIIELFRVWAGDSSKNIEPTEDLIVEFTEGHLDPITQKALRYIEGNLFSVMSITDLARRVGASPATLRRRFSESLARGPQDYIRERRLEEAAKLLQNPDSSISEIASLVGYENFGAFSEAFKKQFGQSPSEYRKNSTK